VEEKEMNEIMQIMKLMEQAPNFSTAGIALFGYCLFHTIKSKANNEINKKMDERFKPLEDKVGNIEKNMNLLISNICPKNGL
jgi:hypothetical protein